MRFSLVKSTGIVRHKEIGESDYSDSVFVRRHIRFCCSHLGALLYQGKKPCKVKFNLQN